MQNLSLNELAKIERMNNLLLNALKQIVIARNNKNYKDMSKEDLLIALIKSNDSHTELLKNGDNSNTEIGQTKKLFSKLKIIFSLKEIKEHRRKLYKKEWDYNYVKEKNTLTKEEEKMLKNVNEYFKKLKEDLSKTKTYQHNTTHDIRYLFNKITKEDYYEPVEIKSAFNGNYIE